MWGKRGGGFVYGLEELTPECIIQAYEDDHRPIGQSSSARQAKRNPKRDASVS